MEAICSHKAGSTAERSEHVALPHAVRHAPSCAVSLTLFCCSLDPLLLLRGELFFAVAAKSLNAHLGSSGSAHPWQQVWVVDGAMRAVGVADGSGDVSCHLCSTEQARSAWAAALLQRGWRAIPPAVPQAEQSLSSFHCMATGKSCEGPSGVIWRVLEEDVVLDVGAQMRHGCEESKPAGRQT